MKAAALKRRGLLTALAVILILGAFPFFWMIPIRFLGKETFCPGDSLFLYVPADAHGHSSLYHLFRFENEEYLYGPDSCAHVDQPAPQHLDHVAVLSDRSPLPGGGR